MLILPLMMIANLACVPAAISQNQQDEDWLDLDRPPEQAICFTLYTVEDRTLKLTAQLYPLADGISRSATLEVRDATGWRTVADTIVDESPYGGPLGDTGRWTANFRVADWDHTTDWPFRVTAADGRAAYEGVIRRDPVHKTEIVAALLSCNSNEDRGPRTDIVLGVQQHDPDLLIFAGDQVYDHTRHLHSWLAFGRQFGELTRNRPTITLPDDHDVGQGNLWGEGGVRSSRDGGDDGGYVRDPRYVNSVQHAQTWHLPDPFDPTPIEQGIGVYYTSIRIGSVDCAIIEDRKFKTGPLGSVAALNDKPGRPDLVTPDQAFDPRLADVPEAELLGERQLAFLRRWGQDWSDVEMKAVLSQTIFSYIGQRSGPWIGPGGQRFNPRSGVVYTMDFDSNGWPQSGRDAALEEIRRSFSIMLCGDQHLPAVAHLGVNGFRDAGVAFAAPAIMNVWARRWSPTSPRAAGSHPDPLIGDFIDGFGNRISMLAYANATQEPDPNDPSSSGGLAEGYGLVRFNTEDRTITMECWPRFDPESTRERTQYPGWPVRVTQDDQYGRAPVGYLPTIEVSDAEEPVVQVIHSRSGELLYTKRWNSGTVQAHTFLLGEHTVRIGEQPGNMIELRRVPATPEKNNQMIRIDLRDATEPWPQETRLPRANAER